jgi:threonine synthase
MMMGMNHFGWYPLPSSGVINPYPREGLKTIAYEICEQLHYEIPQWILIPMGAGTLLSGTMKGLREFHQLGYIDAFPRLVGIQATGCAPLVKAFQENTDPSHISPWPHPQTIAGGLIDPYPWDADTALSAVKKTGGLAHAVTDEKIRNAQILLGKTEGMFAEASGAAGLAGLIELVECGCIDKNDSVVVEITGSGLKESGRFLNKIHPVPTISPDLSSLISTIDSIP